MKILNSVRNLAVIIFIIFILVGCKNDRPLIKNIKNASVAQNPLDDIYGHDYTKRKEFVWNWFEDLNELKFRQQERLIYLLGEELKSIRFMN